eukprot:TRINITY_DN55539_c0_g1_i1.p1 TRINITY_DN55539_c0_g1~~TRINITY_DN55539_c0_g1_i1.p1  ORF type:complete len:887 (-),score=167.22 TRINITY_DN55539_c0_g1_i1:246-2906(-)
MAARRTLEDDGPEDDLMAEGDDEGEGEDLLGGDMLDDYRETGENEEYDADFIDDGEHEAMGLAERMAADQAISERARAGGRRRSRLEGSPEITLGHLSPGGSDFDSLAATSEARRKRRRRDSHGIGASPMAHSSENFEEDEEDDDVPESFYDLSSDKWDPESDTIEANLELKIRRCFQQFLLKFAPEGQTEPKYPDMLRKMAEEAHMHLDVSFNHLSQWSAQLALWICESPNQLLPLLNETLMEMAAKKYATYSDIKEHTDETQLRVAIHSFPVVDKIRDLNTKSINRLVQVHGVTTKRSNIFNQQKRLYLRCAKCNAMSGPFDVEEDTKLQPGSCIDCQSRGPWRVDRQQTLYRNYQKVTLQESPSSVEPGKMPRSKEVILHGDQSDTIRPGDEVTLTGVYRCLYDAVINARTCFPVYKTILESVYVKKKGDVKVAEITDEQQQQILDLAKSPNIRERIISSMAPSIYGMRYVKQAIALCLMGGQRKVAAGKHRIRGDLNVLIVGDPGLAKSQFLKYVEQTFPKSVYTTGKGASAVGLTAALTKDERGEYVLEGGAMVLADDGICLIDEFDKMNDQDRTSLHEAMEQQSISISKAGIVASLQARCAVIAVANPIEGRYDPQQTFAANVGLTDPILSRFDILSVIKDEADAVQDERLADHVACSHIRSHPEANANDKAVKPRLQQKASHIEPIPQELLQKYIIYARQRVFPKLMDLDREKLANFYKDIRAEAFRTGGAPMTARHIESIIRLAEANARLELRQHVNARDLDNALSTMLESFIQSQKHQVAEDLRKRFRRYIAQATPMADQVFAMLEKAFRDKFEQRRISLRPGALPPDVSEVPVDIAEIARLTQINDLDGDEVAAFMLTERFRQSFRKEGDRLYRVV